MQGAAAVEPMNLPGLAAFVSGQRAPIALAVVIGVLLVVALMRRAIGRDASAAAMLSERPDRAAVIGALGEALVAGRVRDLGCPVLRNVVLDDGVWSVEIDLLACVGDGIVVLEIKTWSGFIAGVADAPTWTRYGRGGRKDEVPNAVRQNWAHVAVVERFISDSGVCVRGYVVSAGSAQFAEELGRFVVPLADLGTVICVRPLLPGSREAVLQAWARLEASVAGSDRRRGAHIERVRSRRRVSIAGLR